MEDKITVKGSAPRIANHGLIKTRGESSAHVRACDNGDYLELPWKSKGGDDPNFVNNTLFRTYMHFIDQLRVAYLHSFKPLMYLAGLLPMQCKTPSLFTVNQHPKTFINHEFKG